jgi:hypothetical protein
MAVVGKINGLAIEFPTNYVKSLTGTAGRTALTGTSLDPIVDIDPAYLGQASITTLGTITTGTWNGDIIDAAYLDLAGTIDGTGSTNRVAYFSGANTLTTDASFQTNGNQMIIGDSRINANTLSTNVAVKIQQGDVGTLILAAANIGVQANVWGDNVPGNSDAIGIQGHGNATGTGTSWGGKFLAAGGSTNYAISLVDGTHTVAGRFLKNITSNGDANWADLVEADITDFGSYLPLTGGTITGFLTMANGLGNGIVIGSGSDGIKFLDLGGVFGINFQNNNSQSTNHSISLQDKTGTMALTNNETFTGNFFLTGTKINMINLPTYADDTAAGVGGLLSGDLYIETTSGNRYVASKS